MLKVDPARLAARERFLASAWRELASSLDCELALARVARLAVPEHADWCFLHVLNETSIGRLIEIAHADPEWADLAETLRRNQSNATAFAPLQQQKLVLVPDVHRSWLARDAIAPAYLELLKQIEPQSLLVVPIGVYGRPFAVLLFAYTQRSGRRYRADDVAWASGLASRAGLAIERRVLRDELETANQVNEEFLATLAYELCNPLNSIGGYIRLLQSGDLDRELRSRAAAALERNLSRLRRLVEDLIDTSRAGVGNLDMQMAPLLAARVVGEVIDAARLTAVAKCIAVRCVIQPPAGWILADPNRLRQVMWHLLSNAIKFTPAGGRIDVRVERADSQVKIIVTDTGVGLPPAVLPHIFEPFWQEDPRFSRTHGGLGLGLSLVRRIVELHGGTVRAESAGPGKGATFTVTVPQLAYSETEEPVSNSLIARLEGLRVLLVDDDEDWIEPVVDLLALAGARVLVERSAESTLSRLETEHVHILLMDIALPQLDACELLCELRRSGSKCGRTVRAAALSGRAHPEDRRRAMDAGFQMLLPKSLAAEDLLDAVIRLAAMGVDTRSA
jgi:signal transduction histidine kinase/CheY-like chemotaxis protein